MPCTAAPQDFADTWKRCIMNGSTKGNAMITIQLENELQPGAEATLHLPGLTQIEFYEFCRRNPLLHAERNANGEITLMMPGDTYGGSRNSELVTDIAVWNRKLPTPGLVPDSSSGYTLPSGVERSPDASWLPRSQWDAIPIVQRHPFAHTVPPFVVELMSPSDRLKKAQDKMEEYMANGVALGWLLDRANRTVYVYRPGQTVQTLTDPPTLSGDPELPGLIVDIARIFAPES
ncbi:MAG: Uma2 family endonuclease [Armatimonadetes bacterium]|nr:Uma2 family endonuclease [Armatimonadota bacterium]